MSSTQNAARLVVNRTWRTGLYAKSPKALAIRSRKIRRLVERLRRTMPWLEPSDLPACGAWRTRNPECGAFAGFGKPLRLLPFVLIEGIFHGLKDRRAFSPLLI